LANDRLAVRLELDSNSRLHWTGFWDRQGQAVWTPNAETGSSPIGIRIGGRDFNAQSQYRFLSEAPYATRGGGQGRTLTLQDLNGDFQFELHLELYPGQPVLRQQIFVKNLRRNRVFVRANNILPYSFALEDSTYNVFRVNQWSVLDGGRNFEPLNTNLQNPGQRVTLQTGAGGFQCTWLAIRKGNDQGLIAGWEFDGRADAFVDRKPNSIDLTVRVNSLYHPVEPGDAYEAPAAFLGIFQGDWDEAGYVTQRFAEAALAPPVPDPKFPYMAWDSWGYGNDIDEVKLRAEADRAAQAGAELFIVDLGWAKAMGDWHEDPKKFPSGLRAFSDYVHAKGMKFGLHYVISEAMADSPILQQHPEWACSTTYNYHGAVSLALQHKPVQDWLIEEGVRIINAYNVDWILQDGQTMVKECRNEGLSYDPRDWNYTGDFALSRILQEIQARTPNTVWENCANGGNMMTFRMVRNYVTSITNDASGSLGSRQGLYGASFPFPPRYTDRYMPDVPMTDYNTRSFIFGGPWILMNKLVELPPLEFEFLKQEIQRYKDMRASIRDGKVNHITARPLDGRIDVIQSYNAERDEAIAVIVRDDAAANRYTLRFRDLVESHTYTVTFADDPRALTMPGSQLMERGVSVNLPERESGEIVYARGVVEKSASPADGVSAQRRPSYRRPD
jgi:alpha-galactosidase